MPRVRWLNPQAKKALSVDLRRPETFYHERPTRAATCFIDVPLEANESATTIALHHADRRPTCAWCQRGKLDVVQEWQDPIHGTIGVTLKCDAPECAKSTNI